MDISRTSFSSELVAFVCACVVVGCSAALASAPVFTQGLMAAGDIALRVREGFSLAFAESGSELAASITAAPSDLLQILTVRLEQSW